MPTRTRADVEAREVELRRVERRGQGWLGAELGLASRTVARILRRHQLPYLHHRDPIIGELIRASKVTAVRDERDRPGELVLMDVKKLGRIPDGGGWAALGREATVAHEHKKELIGFDYVHSVVDDHSRYACSEVLDDGKGTTCAAFFLRAAAAFDAAGITIESLITENPLSYRRSNDMNSATALLGVTRIFIKPHCPWQFTALHHGEPLSAPEPSSCSPSGTRCPPRRRPRPGWS